MRVFAFLALLLVVIFLLGCGNTALQIQAQTANSVAQAANEWEAHIAKWEAQITPPESAPSTDRSPTSDVYDDDEDE